MACCLYVCTYAHEVFVPKYLILRLRFREQWSLNVALDTNFHVQNLHTEACGIKQTYSHFNTE